MSWFTPYDLARIILTEYQQMRKLLAQLRPADTKPVGFETTYASRICRACGCDPRSCAEWGCHPPDDTPQTPASLAGRDDGRTAWTNYENRYRG